MDKVHLSVHFMGVYTVPFNTLQRSVRAKKMPSRIYDKYQSESCV